MTDNNQEFDSLFGGTAIVFAGFATQLGLAFLIRVSFARYLSVDAFGLVALFIATLNTVGLLSVAGLDVGIGRFLPRFESGDEHRQDVLRSATEVAIPLSIGAGLLLYLSSDWLATRIFHSPALEPLLVVAAIATPFFGLRRLALGAAQGQERTIPKVLIENLLPQVSQIVLLVVVVSLGAHVLGIVWAYAGGFVVSGLVGGYYLLKHTPLDVRRRGSMHRRLAIFSAPLIVTGIMVRLMEYLDTFLLGYLATSGDVGIYNTVYPLSQLALIFLTSFSFLLLPAISRLDDDDQLDEADRLFKLTTKWIFFLTMPIFFVMFYFPELTISVTFGEKYSAGATALAVLALGMLVHSGLGPTGKGLIAIGQTRLVMLDNTVAASVNVLLNVLLIPTYGIVGAAVASVTAFLTLDVLGLAQLYRHTGIFPIDIGLVRVGAISIPLATLICVVGGELAANSLWRVIPVLVLAGILHLVILVRYGNLTEAELAVIGSAEQTLNRDLSIVRRIVRTVQR